MMPMVSFTLPKMVLSEARGKSFDGCCDTADGITPATVPLALALVHRWKCIAHQTCDLTIKAKWGVSSVSTLLSQQDYGDPNTGGVPVVADLDFGGAPVGKDDFVSNSANRNAHTNVGGTFAAIAKLSKVQCQHIIAKNTGGTTRALHLWQSVFPSLCAGSVSDTDGMSDFAASSIMGIPLDGFSGPLRDQAHLPQRNGGNGHRRSEHIWRAAYIGGFCLEAFGPFNIFGIAPFPREGVLFPGESSLPSLVELTSAWKNCAVRLSRLWHLSQAALAGVVRPPTDDPRHEDPATWAEQLDNQQARLETAFKSQLVWGHCPPTEDDPTWCHKQNLDIQERSFAVARAEGNSWSPFKKLCFDEPQDHPSMLGLWAKQGGEKFQRLTSRLNDMGRFKELFQSLTGLLPQAMFRAKLNPWRPSRFQCF
jgi:hypothetical protein